jgi:hypothetical protein
MGVVNALRLTLLYYILHNEEAKYMAYMEVSSPAHKRSQRVRVKGVGG